MIKKFNALPNAAKYIVSCHLIIFTMLYTILMTIFVKYIMINLTENDLFSAFTLSLIGLMVHVMIAINVMVNMDKG